MSTQGEKPHCTHDWRSLGGAAVKCNLCNEERCEIDCVSPRCPYRTERVRKPVFAASLRVIEAARVVAAAPSTKVCLDLAQALAVYDREVERG